MGGNYIGTSASTLGAYIVLVPNHPDSQLTIIALPPPLLEFEKSYKNLSYDCTIDCSADGKKKVKKRLLAWFMV